MTLRSTLFGAGWLHGLLTVAIGITGLVGILFVFFLLAYLPVWTGTDSSRGLPASFKLPESAWPVVGSDMSRADAAVKLESIRGVLRGTAVSPWRHWFLLVSMLPGFASLLAMFVLLRRIVGSIRQGDVFAEANARRMRWLGLLLIAEAVIYPLWSIWTSQQILAGLTVGGMPLGVDWASEIDPTSFVSGWIVLILSEAFKQGARLRDDQSLTI